MSLPAWSLLVLLALAAAFVALRRLPPRQVLAVVVLAAAIGLAVRGSSCSRCRWRCSR